MPATTTSWTQALKRLPRGTRCLADRAPVFVPRGSWCGRCAWLSGCCRGKVGCRDVRLGSSVALFVRGCTPCVALVGVGSSDTADGAACERETRAHARKWRMSRGMRYVRLALLR